MKRMPPAGFSTTGTDPWNVRHVDIGFDLRDKRVQVQGEVMDALARIFPDTTHIVIGLNRTFLSFVVKRLPKAPWPLTVGRIPITISDNKGNGKGEVIPRNTRRGHLGLTVCDNIDPNKMQPSMKSLRDLFESVIGSFSCSHPSFPIVELIFTIDQEFHVVVEDGFDLEAAYEQTPGEIAGCHALYWHEKDLCRPKHSELEANFEHFAPKYQDRDHPLTMLSENRSDSLLCPLVHLGDPYTGSTDAIIQASGYRRIKDPTTNTTSFQLTEYYYFGQSPESVPDSDYGSPIYDDEERIRSFFWHQAAQGQWKGFGVGVVADKTASSM